MYARYFQRRRLLFNSKNIRTGDELRLFTVGPVACYPEVLNSMSMQMISHRSKEYREIHYDTVDRLKEFIETDNPIYLFTSTGTGFMEASVLNCVKKKMLVCINGSFGKRFADVALAHGRKIVTITPPLGEPILPEELDKSLSDNPDVEAVAITHNETSVGLINDLKALTEQARTHGKLVFVDAVSSMGGTTLKTDEWGIDICFSSSQKCFGVPPGLGIGSVSKEALGKSKGMNGKGWYYDLCVWQKYHREGRGTPMTSAIPQIAGLNAALKMIEVSGGKQWYFDLYQKRNDEIRKGIEKLGLSIFPKHGYESPTVSCVNAPLSSSGPKLYESMRGKGFELAQGYGALKEQTFRIGNMGFIRNKDIKEMLNALGEVLMSS